MAIVSRPVRRINTVTGIATMAAPPLALALMLVTPGSTLTFLFYLGLILGTSYVLLVVMAASGFLGPRAAFSFTERGAVRARIAAWGNAVSIVLAAFFLIDGTDEQHWSSPFIALLGLDRDAVGATSSLLSYVFVLAAAAFYFWLFVEWMLATRLRRRVV